MRKGAVEKMPKPQERAGKKTNSLARELLDLRDELGALNACSAFVMQALSDALLSREGMGRRSAVGAALCVQWLGDRAVELERRLKSLQERAS